MTYAGFWRRFGAMIVDSLIYSVLLALILGPKYVDSDFWSFEGIISNGIALSLTIVLWVRYLGTPGKLLLGCQVVDADTGERMTVKQAMIRYLGYFVSIFTLGIGFLWVAWDKRKQGFHDKIANTVVVYNGTVDVFDESQKSLSQLISEVR
ncbi:RDD family protein [Kaarinaea lacus]